LQRWRCVNRSSLATPRSMRYSESSGEFDRRPRPGVHPAHSSLSSRDSASPQSPWYAERGCLARSVQSSRLQADVPEMVRSRSLQGDTESGRVWYRPLAGE
jgi:hypothetical protein